MKNGKLIKIKEANSDPPEEARARSMRNLERKGIPAWDYDPFTLTDLEE